MLTRSARFSVRFVDSTTSGRNPSDRLADWITWTIQGATGQDGHGRVETSRDRQKLWFWLVYWRQNNRDHGRQYKRCIVYTEEWVSLVWTANCCRRIAQTGKKFNRTSTRNSKSLRQTNDDLNDSTYLSQSLKLSIIFTCSRGVEELLCMALTPRRRFHIIFISLSCAVSLARPTQMY